VNETVMAGIDVRTQETDYESAKKSGAMALFGEKYGDVVRMVNIEGFSSELCGGTHVENTARTGIVKITEERAVGNNMRRIEAFAGMAALAFINEKLDALKQAALFLRIKDTTLPQALQTLVEEREKLQREMRKAGKTDIRDRSLAIIDSAEMVGGTALVCAAADGLSVDAMRNVYDEIKTKHASHAVLLGSNIEGKANLLVALSDDVVARGLDAGALVKEIAREVKGGGGGSKTLAQAGGKDGANVPAAIEKGSGILKGKLA
jgi:alanyl-tRNA synthetase